MPTVLDKNKEEEQNQQDNGQEAVQTSSGAAAQAGGSSSQGAKSFADRKGTSSGSYTNLENYRRGNVQGGQQTTQRIADTATQKAEQADTSLTGEEGRITGELGNAQQTAQAAQDKAKQSLGGLKALEKGNEFKDLYQTYTADIQGGLDTQNQTQQTLDNLNLQDQEQSTAQIQDANEYSSAITNESGRQAALKQMADRPTYTKGQSALDTMLTGTSDNMQTLQQTREGVEARNLAGRQQELQSTLDQRKQDVLRAVELGIMGNDEAQGLLGQIQTEAASLRTGLESQREQLFRGIQGAADMDSLGENQISALRQALGDRLIDTGTEKAVRMGTVDGQDVIVSLDKFLEASGSPGGNFIDTVSNYGSVDDIGLGQVSPEQATILNALTRMSGASPEDIQQQLIQGAELDNLDNMQALNQEDALQYQSRVGMLQDSLDPSIASNFSSMQGLSGNVDLANHYGTHLKAAAGQLVASPGQEANWKSMLTPAQQQQFDSVLANAREEYAQTGAVRPNEFKMFTEMAKQNTSQRRATEDALRNLYGGNLTYEDLMSGIKAAPNDGKVTLF